MGTCTLGLLDTCTFYTENVKQNNGQLTAQRAADLRPNKQKQYSRQSDVVISWGCSDKLLHRYYHYLCLRVVKERMDIVGGREGNYVLEGCLLSLKFEIFSFKIL